MKISRTLIIALTVLCFIITNSLTAQLIIEQTEIDLPVNYELFPEDLELNSEDDINHFILNIPESKLRKAAQSQGKEISEEKVNIYIDGDDMAMESESEEQGKVTSVVDAKTGTISIIMWSEKKVIVMKSGDVQKAERKSQAMVDKMLADLSPEMRKQVEAEMEREKEEYQPDYDLEPTGKKDKINEFVCDEYSGYFDDVAIYVWAASDKEVAKEVASVTSRFEKVFQAEDDKGIDEWQLVEGKIPFQVRTPSLSMMDDYSVNIKSIKSIKKEKPSPDKFKVPGKADGFEKTSMMEMMQQMMPEDE